MKFKIDTKEKLHVITVKETILAAIMTEDLQNVLLKYLSASVKNVIVNLNAVTDIDEKIANLLVNVQQTFYDAGNSLVICCLQPKVEKFLEENEYLEEMNVTPTESEASDIVQMEEIEREFL